MHFRAKIGVVFFSTAVAFYSIVGGFMSKASEAVARGSQYAQITIFDEVLNHIVRDYVDQPDLEKVRVGSLRGLAEGLDPYSAYLTPDQAKQYSPTTSRGETGLILSKVSGFAYVVAVLKGSPAETAGLREGDFIEYIGRLPSRDLSIYETEQLIGGAPGTSIELRVFRRGQSRRFTVPRAKLEQPAIEARVEEPGLGYIKVTSLEEGKAADVKNQLASLTSKGVQKILLDLRGAANGKLQEAVNVANLFIGSGGTIARVLGKEEKELATYKSEPSRVAFTGPLVVVIDRSTAGPAEAIAAAVIKYGRGEVVGERSFGAGSEQQLFLLSDGGGFLVTTAKYAPPSGKPFMDEPVNPTVKVDRPVETDLLLPDTDDDPDQEPQPQTAAPPEPAQTQPVEDVQLKKAIEILKQAAASKSASAQKRASVKRESGRYSLPKAA